MVTRIGRAEAFGHHGELLQGVFEGPDGRFKRGLISLPCARLKSKAVFWPSDKSGVTVTPAVCAKARRAAELVIADRPEGERGGHLKIESNIPVGRGLGSSTADVVATIQAVHDGLQIKSDPHQIMKIAVEAEIACDSTLFHQQAVLFAQREGIVIEAFRRPLPALDILSVDVASSLAVDTLAFEPARYATAERETFRTILSLCRYAINAADIDLLGRVATASARINERFLPKEGFETIERLGRKYGALGIQVAHSGTVVGLLFAQQADPASHRGYRALDALRDAGFTPEFLAA